MVSNALANRPWAASLLRLAAASALVYYAATAHLSRGHEADFGKQWLAARLVATGRGRQLYELSVQRRELERHFSAEVIEAGIWRDRIGGPTYPPTLAVAFAPLGLLPPRWAQWTVVELSLLLVLVAAWQMTRCSAGRLRWQTLTLATLTMPSFFMAVALGQNTAMSLAILATGWSLLVRGRPLGAGAVWGLFALKPTWGLAVAWLPLVLGRPAAYLGMALSAGGAVAATLPFCGAGAWGDWLRVAWQTEHYYQTLPRWTALSRDLPGLLRRLAQGPGVELLGAAVVAAVLLVTAWTWRRRGRLEPASATGPCPAALLAGAILVCPRFMFYDMTLAVLPVLLALADWRQVGSRDRAALLVVVGLLWGGTAWCYLRWQMQGPPLDSFALFGLWLWAVARSHRKPQPCRCV